MKVGVVVFPGSNSDHDAYHAAEVAAKVLANPVIESYRIEVE